jgi:hypothetical protein
MPLTGDSVAGLAGTAVTAAVGLTVVKMTTDMMVGMSEPKKCKKCGKLKSKCKCKKPKADYGGQLFKVDNWMKL